MTDTITLPRSVVEQALSTLEGWSNYDKWVWHGSVLSTAKQNTAEMVPVLRAALEQPQVNSPEIPEGWRLVPVKPTEDMLAAVAWPGCAATDWEHMLAAAPQPPALEQPQSVTDCHQSHPQVEQEPVAYFYTRSGRVVSTEATDALMQQMIGESGRVALYAHPQPPRQPLTDDQIFEVIRPLCEKDDTCRAIISVSTDEYRAIERAHGIMVEKK